MNRFQKYLQVYTAKRLSRPAKKTGLSLTNARPGKVPFSKILNSKWSAVNPANGEKHFLVTRIADHKRREVKLECVMTKRSSIVAYADLVDGKVYSPGWR